MAHVRADRASQLWARLSALSPRSRSVVDSKCASAAVVKLIREQKWRISRSFSISL